MQLYRLAVRYDPLYGSLGVKGLNGFKQKQHPCLLLYNYVRFPGKKALLPEGPQASIVLLVGLCTDEDVSGRTG